ncbi:hypothetical protein ASD06_02545 [Angustibacter sp. Root456]|nr:hypothetical protein ASD06_02545 [Angustibacter sp. Root456]
MELIPATAFFLAGACAVVFVIRRQWPGGRSRSTATFAVLLAGLGAVSGAVIKGYSVVLTLSTGAVGLFLTAALIAWVRPEPSSMFGEDYGEDWSEEDKRVDKWVTAFGAIALVVVTGLLYWWL